MLIAMYSNNFFYCPVTHYVSCVNFLLQVKNGKEIFNRAVLLCDWYDAHDCLCLC